VELAAKAGRQILTDHTFVYTDAVRRIADMSAGGELGRILYYDSTRINLGLFQSDINVIWDLAMHDFAILSRIMPAEPEAISATAIDPMERQRWHKGAFHAVHTDAWAARQASRAFEGRALELARGYELHATNARAVTENR
jgi:predicted dehydrogenase